MTERMVSPTTVAIVGLGSLGTEVVRAVTGDPRFILVGGIESKPTAVGRSVAEVTGISSAAGAVVSAVDQLEVLPQVLVHATESRPKRITDDLVSFLGRGMSVITAAEGFFDPWLRHPEEAARLDAAAKAAGVTITGTGINPGFSLDQIVLDLALATTHVTAIRLTRTVLSADNGPGDVEHVGFGLTPLEFARQIEAGVVEGHIGLPESFVHLAQRLGMEIDRVEETWTPIVWDTPVPSQIGEIAPGDVAGIVQNGRGLLGDRVVLSANLKFFYGRIDEREVDTIEIDGTHDIRMRLTPSARSVPGSAAVIANTIPLLADAPNGFVVSLDLPSRLPRSPLRYAVADGTRPGLVRLRRVDGAVPT